MHLSQMPPPSLERRSLLILTASVTGTAVDIAERIGRTARRHGWSAAVKDVDQFDRVSRHSYDLLCSKLTEWMGTDRVTRDPTHRVRHVHHRGRHCSTLLHTTLELAPAHLAPLRSARGSKVILHFLWF